MRLRLTSLKWALKHMIRESDTDVFPRPFEFDLIKKRPTPILQNLATLEVEQYVWKGPRRLMVPKGDYAFRPVCQLDPLDSLFYAGILKEIGRKIERNRIPETDDVIFSYRFDPQPNGQLYKTVDGYGRFWSTSQTLCSQYSHVLVTDISDFYNQIYHHTIENQLISCNIAQPYITAIKRLIPNTTEGVSRGVPIGPHPSHLLAEMSMIPVDSFLQSINVRFCRYVDDIHIFCNDRAHAQTVMFQFVEYLDKTQKLQINKQKTKIYNSAQFSTICADNAIDRPINDLEKELLSAVRNYTRSPYEKISIKTVSPTDLTKLSQSNIESVLNTYISMPEVDYIRLRWFLRRLAQLGVPGGIEFIVKKFDEFLPAVADVARYFEAAARNYNGEWAQVGKDLITVYNSGLVQASEYLRVIILSLFSNITGINQINVITGLFPTASDMCKRKILLAAAKGKAAAWLGNQKSLYKNSDPWTQRAAIYAMRALPDDERKFWLRSAKSRLQGLSHFVAEAVPS